VDERVKFYEKGSGHATFFTKEGVYISLVSGMQAAGSKGDESYVIARDEVNLSVIARDEVRKQSPNLSIHPFIKEGQGGITSETVKLSFLNANPNPEIIAVDSQEGKVNYFIGNDPKKWRPNIPTYRTVVYKEVYPGIDIKFYGNNRQMEYDIIIKPGADPSTVRLSYEGIEELRGTDNGDLEILLKEGKIIQKKPYI
jgi:hypothetical protein